MFSALRTIGSISQTASEFTRRGVQGLGNSLSRVPLIAEHRAGVQARVEASTNTSQSAAYTPYTRFLPRGKTRGHGSAAATPNSNPKLSLPDVSQSAVYQTIQSPPAYDTPSLPSSPHHLPGEATPSVLRGPAGADSSDFENSPYNGAPRPSSRGRPRDQDGSSSRSRNSRSMSPLEYQRSSHSSNVAGRRSRSPILSHTSIALLPATAQDSTGPMDQDPNLSHLTTSDTPPTSHPDGGIPMDADPDSLQQATFVPLPGCPSTPPTASGYTPMDADPAPPHLSSPVEPQGAASPPSTTPSGAGLSPSRPLALPTSFENIIDRVVAQRLNAATAGIVEPTVQGIIDACIPRLTELIESRFAMLDSPQRTERSGHRGKGPSRPSGSFTGEDWDGDNEDDSDDSGGATTVTRRRKPGPRGKMNRLHETFRTYLRDMKVIPSRPKGDLPASAPADAVCAFNLDGVSPPSLPNISLDWNCTPLSSSRWNSEAIALLSHNFYEKLKDGSYKNVAFDEDTMSLSKLRKLCEQKLVRTHQAHRKQARINSCTGDEVDEVTKILTTKEERRRKGDRMTARRHGTLARRKRIAEQNRSRDPEKWDAIRRITERLNLDGMSCDETDSAPGTRPKVLRRTELPWISPAISGLFKSVESYESALREENMLEQIGNSALKRHWEAGRQNRKAAAVPGLPRNWYNDAWFQGLTPGARSMLSVRADVPIPTLVLYQISMR